MNKEIEDDWNPDPAEKRTILNLKKVVFLDKDVRENKRKVENEVYDATIVREYAEENWITDEDDAEMDESAKEDFRKIKEQLMSEQIFYDPIEDCKNEHFVSKRYKQEKSDVHQVLNCPNCFTTLTYHYQKHAVYKHQYRSTVTANTKINFDKFIDESTFQVYCKACGVDVAAYDFAQKVYHFYNVIPANG